MDGHLRVKDKQARRSGIRALTSADTGIEVPVQQSMTRSSADVTPISAEPDDHRGDERNPLPIRYPKRPIRTSAQQKHAARRLGVELLGRVAEGDAWAEAHGTTAPRTAAEKKARLIERGGLVA